MLLRASGKATNTTVDLKSAMTGCAEAPTEVPQSDVLLKFCEAAVVGTEEELETARHEVLATLGPTGLVDAAAVVGNFERNVRIADSTGIPLDDFLDIGSSDFRDDLGINNFANSEW